MMNRACSIAIVIAAFAGCESPFEPKALVSGLRVLAAVAEPAEVVMGEQATVRALAVDRGGAPITLDWATCLEPVVAGSRSTTSEACFSEPDSPAVNPIGQGETQIVTMPTLTFEEVGLPDVTFGFYLPIRIRATTATERVDSVYRLRIALPPPYTTVPNHNPKLDQIFIIPTVMDGGVEPVGMLTEDAAHPVRVGEKLGLRALVRDGSQEQYTRLEGDPRNMNIVQATELVRVSWYSTYGTFTEDRTGVERPNTTWTAEKYLPEVVPEGGVEVMLYVVARDERGGQDYLVRRLLLTP